MNFSYQTRILLVGALAFMGTAFAQVPSANDKSDAKNNTGTGTGALGGPNSANLNSYNNTAIGYNSLNSDTTGGANTAIGVNALTNNFTGILNTASGYDALYYSNGDYNTATGANALYINDTGSNNTASGYQALQDNTTGYQNTAVGSGALVHNGTSNYNTALGYQALYSNAGASNTAAGVTALYSNTSGFGNAAYGVAALYSNTTGNSNTATGLGALYLSISGSDNSASGYQALYSNTTGSNNTASGYEALYSNTTGANNTASGYGALHMNKAGAQNAAFGVDALFANTGGKFNTAVGYGALKKNSSGQYNVALGWQAGFALTTGSNNIDIDNQGEAGDNDTIRIGTEGTQTNTSIAGVYSNTGFSGAAVLVDMNGRLGVAGSSERFKTAIAPIGPNSARLQRLRPVTFHYKADPQGSLQYGLIAEEVAKVYPELVIRGEKGRIDGIRYDELAPMLLNEVQQQTATIRDLKQEQLHVQLEVAELKALNQATQAALQKLQAREEILAQR
jgi:trimeric autotransporter adhesin